MSAFQAKCLNGGHGGWGWQYLAEAESKAPQLKATGEKTGLINYVAFAGVMLDLSEEQVPTLHPAPCTLHPAPCTLHPAPCTLNPGPPSAPPTKSRRPKACQGALA